MDTNKKYKVVILIGIIALLVYLYLPGMLKGDVDSQPLAESEIVGDWGYDLTFNADNTVNASDARYFTIKWEVSNSDRNEVRIRYSVTDQQLDLYIEELFMPYIDDYEDGYWPTKEDILYDIREWSYDLDVPQEGLYKFNRTEQTLTLADDEDYVLEKHGVATEKRENEHPLMRWALIIAAIYLVWDLFSASGRSSNSKTKTESSNYYTYSVPQYTSKPKRTGYISGGWTRHDAFSQILHDNPPHSDYHEGDIVVLNVRFNSYGHTYCYRAKDNVYKAGDIVEVKVSGSPRIVTVDSVGYYSTEEYPFDVVQLNYVEGMASGELAERYRKAIDEEIGAEEEREKIRRDAAEELKSAKADLENASRMKKEAEKAHKETEQKRKETQKTIEETVNAGKKARQEKKKLEAAQREASKTWKHKRSKTDNEIILRLRKVQDVLDEDEQIYKELSKLEDKMIKVIAKADELVEDNIWDNTTDLIKKLYDFYLPKTISVLEQYKNIFTSGLPQKSVEKLREDAFSAIDKSVEVYNNILTSLYEQDMLELSSEMQALQTMFAVEGLLNSDFDLKA